MNNVDISEESSILSSTRLDSVHNFEKKQEDHIDTSSKTSTILNERIIKLRQVLNHNYYNATIDSVDNSENNNNGLIENKPNMILQPNSSINILNHSINIMNNYSYLNYEVGWGGPLDKEKENGYYG